MKAVRKPVCGLVVVDLNGGKLVTLFDRFRILTDHRLGKRHADLGAFRTNALQGEQVSHGRVLLCPEVAVRGRDIWTCRVPQGEGSASSTHAQRCTCPCGESHGDFSMNFPASLPRYAEVTRPAFLE